tara:strand:+ start:530 stop:646 length:117 start_codon:yes stop_codon:yes gene_type:complete
VRRKITIPSIETRKRAANILGISNLKLDSRILEARPVF